MPQRPTYHHRSIPHYCIDAISTKVVSPPGYLLKFNEALFDDTCPGLMLSSAVNLPATLFPSAFANFDSVDQSNLALKLFYCWNAPSSFQLSMLELLPRPVAGAQGEGADKGRGVLNYLSVVICR